MDEMTRIFIGRLSNRTQGRDLENIFSAYGKVQRVDLKEGYAFVFFADEKNAHEAITAMDGKELDGSSIVVEPARNTSIPRNINVNKGNSELRLSCLNLDPSTSWQDLKDWARAAGKVTFANVFTRDSQKLGVIEFESTADVQNALQTLEEILCNGARVRLEKEDANETGGFTGGLRGEGDRRGGGGGGYGRDLRERDRGSNRDSFADRGRNTDIDYRIQDRSDRLDRVPDRNLDISNARDGRDGRGDTRDGRGDGRDGRGDGFAARDRERLGGDLRGDLRGNRGYDARAGGERYDGAGDGARYAEPSRFSDDYRGRPSPASSFPSRVGAANGAASGANGFYRGDDRRDGPRDLSRDGPREMPRDIIRDTGRDGRDVGRDMPIRREVPLRSRSRSRGRDWGSSGAGTVGAGSGVGSGGLGAPRYRVQEPPVAYRGVDRGVERERWGVDDYAPRGDVGGVRGDLRGDLRGDARGGDLRGDYRGDARGDIRGDPRGEIRGVALRGDLRGGDYPPRRGPAPAAYRGDVGYERGAASSYDRGGGGGGGGGYDRR